MFSKIKIKIIFFTLFVNVIIFFGPVEWFAGYLIQGDNIYKNRGMIDGNHPLMEFDGDLGYQIRKKAMGKLTHTFPMIIEKQKIINTSGKPISTKLSFTDQEGIIRSEHGDIVINSLGYRGPYFKNKKSPDTFRIVAMGGSSTAGMYENELTYPRLLERMLNRSSADKIKIEVINAGVWGYTSCQVAKKYKKEIASLKPDVILLMIGWNDINSRRKSSITKKSQYCTNHHSILVRSNIFRFLRLKISEGFKKNASELGIKNFQYNAKYYLENLRKIIEDAGTNRTQVVLVSLPSLFEAGNMDNFSKYEQFSGLSLEEIKYRQSSVLYINSLKKKIANEYKHVFYIDSGVSPLTEGKSEFFAGTAHLTGAGNRVLAFQLFKYLNERYKFSKTFSQKYREENWSKNKLELEYLKSIFASNQTEDLSFSACLALHGGVCTYKQDSIPKHVHMTGINEFVLGSILQFPLVSKSSDFKSLFENLMRKAIDLSPNFSVSYWIFGTFYSINGEKELARNYLEQAFKINPLLKDFSFKRNSIEFMKNFRKDPFIFDFRKFVNFIKRDYVPGAHFMKYNFHLSVGYLNEKSPEEAIARHMEFYYFSPLLARSIFLRTASYLKNREQPGLANKIIKKTQQLITQNSLHVLP
jgi:lysophospholipase L1-like esterase